MKTKKEMTLFNPDLFYLTTHIGNQSISQIFHKFGNCLCCGLEFGLKTSLLEKNVAELIEYGCFVNNHAQPECDKKAVCETDCEKIQLLYPVMKLQEDYIFNYCITQFQEGKITQLNYIVNTSSSISCRIILRFINLAENGSFRIHIENVKSRDKMEIMFVLFGYDPDATEKRNYSLIKHQFEMLQPHEENNIHNHTKGRSE